MAKGLTKSKNGARISPVSEARRLLQVYTDNFCLRRKGPGEPPAERSADVNSQNRLERTILTSLAPLTAILSVAGGGREGLNIVNAG
jgi:predicted small lipoprotein YifL